MQAELKNINSLIICPMEKVKLLRKGLGYLLWSEPQDLILVLVRLQKEKLVAVDEDSLVAGMT